ncbi:hypothetical protein GLAREA_00088 [Glarea lozoyensis ATCC 20868]|uniref:Uncharacterized protein n=1 Tax=Glarea lozoyensis (strain ATCC 20868 / MF5171) TaxID=1116229 RepID=S3CTE9_GLAL2|nr:uncharacterized protein GLAREA_00088 [Glarea lozoyensis ATCC 20868]EPE28930.1 hypothetical protein GLAREA_00088 [Glarea lozoyensis ATCC 20868]
MAIQSTFAAIVVALCLTPIIAAPTGILPAGILPPTSPAKLPALPLPLPLPPITPPVTPSLPPELPTPPVNLPPLPPGLPTPPVDIPTPASNSTPATNSTPAILPTPTDIPAPPVVLPSPIPAVTELPQLVALLLALIQTLSDILTVLEGNVTQADINSLATKAVAAIKASIPAQNSLIESSTGMPQTSDLNLFSSTQYGLEAVLINGTPASTPPQAKSLLDQLQQFIIPNVEVLIRGALAHILGLASLSIPSVPAGPPMVPALPIPAPAIPPVVPADLPVNVTRA